MPTRSGPHFTDAKPAAVSAPPSRVDSADAAANLRENRHLGKRPEPRHNDTYHEVTTLINGSVISSMMLGGSYFNCAQLK